MSNKTEIIYEALDEIRDILGAECTPIDELPDVVRSVVNDPRRGGFTTVFLFSAEKNPVTPSATTLDVSTGLVDNVDDGWSQTSFSGSKTSNVWMSFAIFNPSGDIVGNWAVPINIKGAPGDKGEVGETGQDGAPGEKGDPGLDGIIYRTAMAYTTTDTLDAPAKPVGGFWNRELNEVLGITSTDGNEWYTNSDQGERKTYRWISEAIFEQDGNVKGDWSEPFRMTGENGEDGVDGRTIEFVYRLLPDMDAYNDLRVYLTKNPLQNSVGTDIIPPTKDDICDTDWTDSPSGISEEYPIEVVSSRQWDETIKSWKPWSNCIIWSKWGEDGTDGDGIEYIYLITPKKVDGEDITPDYVQNHLMPDLTELCRHPRYQENEFCINEWWSDTESGFNLAGYDWTDEPSDVSKTEPVEWVSVRKKTVPEGSKVAVWGQFSTPKIWAKFAADGDAFVTSHVFARASDTPDTPTGGSFSNPLPDQTDVWSDSVPSGTERVWMSTRTFSSNATSSYDKGWTAPKVLSDSPSFQVEYTDAETVNKQFLGSLNDYIGTVDPEDAWRTNQLETYGITWGDDDLFTSEGREPIWMITSNYTNGRWSNWVLTRIKGEKGEEGLPGQSVKIRFKSRTEETLREAWTDYISGDSFKVCYDDSCVETSEEEPLVGGDGCFVDETGLLYVYSGGWNNDADTSAFNTYWTSVEIKGEPGDSNYIYRAYCNDPYAGKPITFDEPDKYIGFATSTSNYASDNPILREHSFYQWARWEGEDGWGYEQIFILTSKNSEYNTTNHPPLPSRVEGDNVPEYLPAHGFDNESDAYTATWQDTPMDVSEDYPFCWVATRKVEGTTTFHDWTGWQGYASLYSRYSYDGVSSANVDLTNNVANIPMEDGVIDPDFTDTVTTSVNVYVGDDEVDSEDITVLSDSEYFTVNGVTLTMNLDKITSEVTSIPVHVKIGDSDKVYTVLWHVIMSDTAYSIEPNTFSIRRYTNGEKAGKLENTALDVYVYKWNGKAWLESNTPLFAEITKTNGSLEYYTQEDKITRTDHRATIDLTECIDAAKIVVYVVKENDQGKYTKDGVRLEWEVIQIAADGLNGGKFDVSLYPDELFVPVDKTVVDPAFITKNETTPEFTMLTVRREGLIVPGSSYTVTIDEEYKNIFEVEMEPSNPFVPTGRILVKDASQLINVDKLPITVTPNWDVSDSRVIDWRIRKASMGYDIDLSETLLSRSPIDGSLEDNKVYAKLYKNENGAYTEVTDKIMFYKISYAKSSAQDTKGSVAYDTTDNRYSFTFEGEKFIKKIYFYITEDNTNNEDSVVLASETINVSELAQSAVDLVITPDFLHIPTQDGTIDPDYSNATETIKIEVYEGQNNVTSNYTVTTNLAGTLTTDSVPYTFTFTPFKALVKDGSLINSVWFKATDNNNTEISRTQYLDIIYDDSPFKIVLDSSTLKINENGKVDNAFTGSVLKWNGQNFVGGVYDIKFSLSRRNTTSPIVYSLTTEQDGTFSWNPHSTTSVNDLSDATTLILEVFQDNKVAKKEFISLVFDGTSPYSMATTPDWFQVPTENGGIDPDLDPSETFDTIVSIYYGSTKLSYGTDYDIWLDSAVEKIVTKTITDSNDCKLSFAINSTNWTSLDESITITAVHTTHYVNVYNKTFSIAKDITIEYTDNPYKLDLRTHVVTVDPNNNPLTGTVEGYLYKWDGTAYVAASSDCTIRLAKKDTPTTKLEQTPGTNGAFSFNISTWTSVKELVLTCIKDETTLFVETIGYAKHGKDGTSPLHIELSNDFTMVATDSDGNLKSGWDESTAEETQWAETEATVFYGLQDITNDVGVDIDWSLVEDDTATFIQDNNKLLVTDVVADEAKFKCTVEYGGITVTKFFEVIKSKGLTTYKLVPSASMFTYPTGDSTTGSPSKITFSVSKWEDGTYTTVTDLSSENLKISPAELTPKKESQVVTLTKNETVVDKETIGYVTGAKEPIHLELSNDFTMVATDGDGNIISGWDEDATDTDVDFAMTEATMYCGQDDVTSSTTFNWSMTPSNGGTRQSGQTGAKFSLVGMTVDALQITCNATYGSTTITKEFNVLKSKGQDVYKIVPSANLFVWDSDGNSASPSSITCKVVKWSNGAYTEVPSSNYKSERLTLSHSTINADKSATIVTLKKDDVIIDQETIGWVQSGKDGTGGKDGEDGTILVSVQYGSSSSSSIRPTTWQDTEPTVTLGHYLWTKKHWSNGTDEYSYVRQAKDGLNGVGTPGPSILYRGEWAKANSYKGSGLVKECVLYGDTYYMAKKDIAANTDWNADNWDVFGESFSSIATGTLLAEGAEVGGMTFNNGYLYSGSLTDNAPGSNTNFYINGANGTAAFSKGKVKFNADSAEFKGNLIATGLYVDFKELDTSFKPTNLGGGVTINKSSFDSALVITDGKLSLSGKQQIYVNNTLMSTNIKTSDYGIDSIKLQTKTLTNNATSTQYVQINSSELGAYRDGGSSTRVSDTGISGYNSSNSTKFSLNSSTGDLSCGNLSCGAVTASGKIDCESRIEALYGFYEQSDERLKTFKNSLNIDFNKLKDIPKKYFVWNSDDNELQIGTSAQEVQKLYPELVHVKDNGILSVDYAKLSIVALAAIDKLHEENNELKERLNKLEEIIYGIGRSKC